MDAPGIEHILRELGCEKIKEKNGTVYATCPFAPYTHAKGIDRNPSFGMDINGSGTSKWGCFACGEGANQTYSLIHRFRDKCGTFHEDLLFYIREQEGSSLSYRLSQVEYKPHRRRVENPQFVATKVQDYEPSYDIKNYMDVLSWLPDYAAERHIGVDLARLFGIGYLRRGMLLKDGYKSSTDRIFFVVKDHTGKMVGWSGRRINDEPWSNGVVPPKYIHAPDSKKERYLYGEHLVDKSIRIGLVSESHMDVLNLSRFGVKNVLAIMGASASLEQLTKLNQWFDVVFVLQHADLAGEKMAASVVLPLQTMGTKAIAVPPLEGRKDSGEWSESETFGLLKELGIFDVITGQGGQKEKA